MLPRKKFKFKVATKRGKKYAFTTSKRRNKGKRTFTFKGKKTSTSGRSYLYDTFAEALTPPEILKVSEHADKYRMLPEISSHESGRWRTSRFPFLKRIMDCLTPDDPARQVVVMKGAQLGFTEVFLNWAFYTIGYEPGPMLYVQKTLDAVDVFLKQRFDPSISEMPDVKDLIGVGKLGRKTGDTAKIKIFPGGMIRFGGANSAASLRSMPIERLCLDEEDSYDSDIQDEGSPSELAIARTRNFPNRKVYRISTPTIKETSVIEPLFEAGTKERFYVPCPHCGNMDYIRWENIKWQNEDPKTAMLVCEECGSFIEERYKTQMFSKGVWIAENPDAEYPSFHISSLYSPYGFYSWQDAVRLWIKAKNHHSNTLLKTFVNTVLGETWSESGDVTRSHELEARKEYYPAEVPQDVIVLTAGADVQKDRIECEVVGWGKGMESYSISYKVFRGDTNNSAVWELFDLYLKKQFKHASGMNLPILGVGVDSGFRTKVVYEFCKAREHRNVFPIKGDDGWGKGTIDRPLKRNKYGVWAFRSFVDEIKSNIYSYLNVTDPGPGYCHFPNKDVYDKNYFKMLVSENLKRVWLNGKYKLQWKLPEGRRNEALDCRCINYAILQIIIPNFDSLPINQPLVLGPAKAQRRRRTMSKGVS